MTITDRLAAAEAANIMLDTENAQLRQALRVIRKGLSDDADGEFWPARQWLDTRNIYHGDLSGNRVLELVAKHALHGEQAEFTPAPVTPEPPLSWERQEQAAVGARLKGRCPSCGHETLFYGSKGYITCSWLPCRNPGAVGDLLADVYSKSLAPLPASEARPTPPGAVLVSREDAEAIEDVLRLAASSSNDADEVDNLTRLAAKIREGQS